MRMQIVTSTGHRFPFSIKMLLLLVGGTALLTFAFFGRDLSPQTEHYANRTATETVTQKVIAPAGADDITLTFTDPAANVRQPSSYTSQYQVGGWVTPEPASDRLDVEDEKDNTNSSSAASSAEDCDELAQRIHDTQDYRGTEAERSCFGEEDDPRVGLALDYGKTEAGYAASEQTLKPGSYGCMLVADGIVANGWQGTQEQVDCFGYDDLAGINDAYGALEEGRTSY